MHIGFVVNRLHGGRLFAGTTDKEVNRYSIRTQGKRSVALRRVANYIIGVFRSVPAPAHRLALSLPRIIDLMNHRLPCHLFLAAAGAASAIEKTPGDPLLWAVLIATAILFLGTAALMGWIVAMRLFAARERERWARFAARVEPPFFEFLSGEGEGAAVASALRTARDRERLKKLTLGYLRDLAGEDRRRILLLWEELGLAAEEERVLDRSLRAGRVARAAHRLGLVGRREAAGGLLRCMAHRSRAVRVTAAHGLLRLGDPEGVDVALDTLTRRRLVSPARAAHMILTCGHDYSARLLKLLDGERMEPEFTRLLISLVEHLQLYDAADTLRAHYLSGDPETRIRVLKAFARIYAVEHLDIIQQALAAPCWEERAMAARAAGEIGETDFIPILESMLSDDCYWPRRNAARALAAMGGEGKAALEKAASKGSGELAAVIATEALEDLAE